MAYVSNVNRRASAKAIIQQVATLKTIAGLAIQTHRAYESPSRQGKGRTQEEVASQAGASQATVSNLENGKICGKVKLLKILEASGFNLSKDKGGLALFNILVVIRENEENLEKLLREPPA